MFLALILLYFYFVLKSIHYISNYIISHPHLSTCVYVCPYNIFLKWPRIPFSLYYINNIMDFRSPEISKVMSSVIKVKTNNLPLFHFINLSIPKKCNEKSSTALLMKFQVNLGCYIYRTTKKWRENFSLVFPIRPDMTGVLFVCKVLLTEYMSHKKCTTYWNNIFFVSRNNRSLFTCGSVYM